MLGKFILHASLLQRWTIVPWKVLGLFHKYVFFQNGIISEDLMKALERRLSGLFWRML